MGLLHNVGDEVQRTETRQECPIGRHTPFVRYFCPPDPIMVLVQCITLCELYLALGDSRWLSIQSMFVRCHGFAERAPDPVFAEAGFMRRAVEAAHVGAKRANNGTETESEVRFLPNIVAISANAVSSGQHCVSPWTTWRPNLLEPNRAPKVGKRVC